MEYSSHIAPSKVAKKHSLQTQKSDKERVYGKLVKPKSLPLSTPRHTYRLDYIHNTNYYANKERFFRGGDALKQVLKTTKQLASSTILAQTYAAPFTTFKDITKPKRALAPKRLHFNSYLQSSYKDAKLRQIRQDAVMRYRTNDALNSSSYTLLACA